MDAALRDEIEGLAALGTPALKAKYVEAFGERSRSGNAAFLRKRIAWRLQARAMGGLLPAVVESVEEAILNSLFRAETVIGRDGHVRHALPVEEVVRLVRRHRPSSLEGEAG